MTRHFARARVQGDARIGIRLEVMGPNLLLGGTLATLVGCAAFACAGEADDVHLLCREVARVEGRSPMAVRFWLAKLWGAGLVEMRGTRPTEKGWAEIEGEGAREGRAA